MEGQDANAPSSLPNIISATLHMLKTFFVYVVKIYNMKFIILMVFKFIIFNFTIQYH